jgi:NAD(P)-dependent dehydrogenase (short-subunit alcohol dehydrogenase family)
MSDNGSIVVVGGTQGIGLEVARHYAERGREVVLTGRESDRAEAVASKLGGKTRGLALELARPEEVAAGLRDVGPVDRLVLAAIDRDENSVRDYDIERAVRLVVLKLVGYTEVVHALVPKLNDDSSIVLFGGQAKDRPYPGSTTVTTVNGGITAMVRTMALELAPIRVNGIHPGIVGDSPYWSAKPDAVLEGIRSRNPTGRLVTMQEVVGAVVFLLENGAVNGVDLVVNAGALLQ